MSRSHFKGFKDGVQISGISMNVHQKGQVFYVCNSSVVAPNGMGGGDGVGMGKSPEKPFATLDAAINACTASRGDKIIILPGHVETIASATTVVPDVAGVHIIGVGDGALKPLFNFSATTSNIIVSGANIKIQGISIAATIDSVVAGITVTGAGVELDIESRDTSALIEFVSAIVTEATADNLKIKARHRGFVAGNAMTRYIDIVGCRDAQIEVDFFGIASVAVVNLRTTACDNVRVTGNFYNETGALTYNVVNSTTSTWSVYGHDDKGGYDFSGSDDAAVTVISLPDPSGAFLPGLGYRITKTSNMADGSGTDNLFTVSGRCLITHLSGEVTTQIGTTTTMKITDVTNSIDFCAATTITTDVVGTIYVLNGVSTQILNGTANAPVVGSAGSITAAGFANPRIVGDVQGAITVAHVLDGAGTGAVAWVLYYLPLTSASSIVAAA